MSNYRYFYFVCFLYFLSDNTYALDFGEITIYSKQNEPLEVIIEVVGDSDNYTTLIVDVASQQDHYRYRIPRASYQTDLNLEFIGNEDTKKIIYLTSELAIKASEVRFLLVLFSGRNQYFRDVRIPLEANERNKAAANSKLQPIKRVNAIRLPSMQVIHIPLSYSKKQLRIPKKKRGPIGSTLKLKWELKQLELEKEQIKKSIDK